MRILPTIRGHEDLLALTDSQRTELCREIRGFIVGHVANTGGHLASNLGVVELSVAIETVFDTSKDRLVFDVGHQSYIHKLLTGRQADFEHLRSYGGMSGFPKPSESDTDSFVAGHASSSVSIALGMARARKLTGQDYNVVALIGDGAFTGGMAYEGMNDAGESREPMVVILNDNEMSIDRNVGGIAKHLYRLRTKEGYFSFKKVYRKIMTKIPGGAAVYRLTHKLKERLKRSLLRDTIFGYMGFEYFGPVDGHDLPQLIQMLKAAKDLGKPVLVHVITQKGHGYKPAEEDPSRFHGIGRFNPRSGQSLSARKETYSDVFGDELVKIASKNARVCAITAAMPGGTGLLTFKERFPDRLFDVGIAEEHAVSMAGGLAKQGAVPVVAIYSTFLQRGYDQIMQDVGLLGLHVVFAIDRAGLVGEDGPTHHGVFDVGFLRQVPGMTVLCPCNFAELRVMLHWAVNECTGPVAIRYPRGGEGSWTESTLVFGGDPNDFLYLPWGDDVTLITYGSISDEVITAARDIKCSGVHARVLRLFSASHIPGEKLARHISGKHVIVVEEACSGSGIKEAIAWELDKYGVQAKVHGLDLGSNFTPHGDLKTLRRNAGLDSHSIVRFIHEVRQNEK